MRSIPRIFVALAALVGLAVAGLAFSSHENPALAAKAKSSKAQAGNGKANSGATKKSGFEHQQCTWEDPCKIHNFY
jgi:hypothetical protein